MKHSLYCTDIIIHLKVQLWNQLIFPSRCSLPLPPSLSEEPWLIPLFPFMQRGSLDVPTPQSWLLFNALSLSLHFLAAAPFKWLCAKLKQAFFLDLPLSTPPSHQNWGLKKNLTYSLLLTPSIYSSQTFTNLSSSPLIYLGTYSMLLTHTETDTHTLVLTHIQTHFHLN